MAVNRWNGFCMVAVLSCLAACDREQGSDTQEQIRVSSNNIGLEYAEPELVTEQKLGDYLIRIIRLHPNQIEQRLEIWTKDQGVLSAEPSFVFEGGTLMISPEQATGSEYALPYGVDVIGDSSPEFIVREWSGGAHCCFTDYIISLRASITVQSIDLGHGEQAAWKQDQDGEWVLHAKDWTFSYWEASFAGSAVVDIVLAGQSEVFVPSEKHMKRVPVDRTTLEAMATELSTWMDEGQDDPKARLAEAMLDLMYSGQREAASVLLELVLPKGHPLREEFETRFYNELSLSPWWPAVSEFSDPGITDAKSE